MHRHPRICHNKISPLHGNIGVTLGAIKPVQGPFRIKRFWPRKHQFKIELLGGMGKTGKDVVTVTRPNHLLAFDRAVMLFKRHDIGHDLARMRAVGQPVDHRHRRMLGHIQERLLFKGPDHDQIDVAR